MNLLRNAIDAMEYSKPEDRKLVASSTLEKPREVVISVMDRGSGLPRASEGRVFDPFFTTNRTGWDSVWRSVEIL